MNSLNSQLSTAIGLDSVGIVSDQFLIHRPFYHFSELNKKGQESKVWNKSVGIGFFAQLSLLY